MIANRPTTLRFSVVDASHSLKHQSDEDYHGRGHRSGWGISAFNGHHWDQGRWTTAAIADSDMAEKTSQRPGTIIIAHIRSASAGYRVEEVNTHPFVEEPWAFAHNGTICSSAVERLQRTITATGAALELRPRGATDSETFFYAFLSELYSGIRRLAPADPQDTCRALHTIINQVGSDHRGLNFLLSNGRELYFYRDTGGDETKTLHTIRRRAAEQEWVRSQSPSEILEVIRDKQSSGEEAILVASEMVATGDRWNEFPERRLGWIANALQEFECDLLEIDRA